MGTRSKTPRADIYTRVTEKIIQDLEQGVRPWMKPWNSEILGQRIMRPLRSNGVPYRGINVLMLWMSAEAMGFHSPHWFTFNQVQELGGKVLKGEHGSPVVYANKVKKTDFQDGDEVELEFFCLREYVVFNLQQTTGLPERFSQSDMTPKLEPMERIERADRFFANLKADVRIGGTKAYYAIDGDYIRMPPFECFRDAEAHTATLSHEQIHWTRHPSRLNRDFGRKRWGDEAYAQEELVAELGSAFLCADLEITPEVQPDHANYIGSWLKVLKEDQRCVFTAAAHAAKAVDYMQGLQPGAKTMDEPAESMPA